VFEPVPRLRGASCSIVDNVGSGLWHVVARFGFIEIPDLRRALRQIPELCATVDFDTAVFIGTRDLVVHKPHSRILRSWRLRLFAFLYRNSAKVMDRFNLPAHNVIEIARQIEI
jgi:KUP system potassium uptake protein